MFLLLAGNKTYFCVSCLSQLFLNIVIEFFFLNSHLFSYSRCLAYIPDFFSVAGWDIYILECFMNFLHSIVLTEFDRKKITPILINTYSFLRLASSIFIIYLNLLWKFLFFVCSHSSGIIIKFAGVRSRKLRNLWKMFPWPGAFGSHLH